MLCPLLALGFVSFFCCSCYFTSLSMAAIACLICFPVSSCTLAHTWPRNPMQCLLVQLLRLLPLCRSARPNQAKVGSMHRHPQLQQQRTSHCGLQYCERRRARQCKAEYRTPWPPVLAAGTCKDDLDEGACRNSLICFACKDCKTGSKYERPIEKLSSL